MALSLEKRLKKLAKKKTAIRLATQAKLFRRKRRKYILYYSTIVFAINVLALFVWKGSFKHTFVDGWTLVFVGVTCGAILSLPLLWLHKMDGVFFFFVISMLSANMFLVINRACTTVKLSTIEKKSIVKKRPSKGRYDSSVDIRYNGNIVNFSVKEIQLDSASYVIFTIKQGYFGYAFIDDYKISAE